MIFSLMVAVVIQQLKLCKLSNQIYLLELSSNQNKTKINRLERSSADQDDYHKLDKEFKCLDDKVLYLAQRVEELESYSRYHY